MIVKMCLGKGAIGLTSPSGSEISAFLTSFIRYPVQNKWETTGSEMYLYIVKGEFQNTGKTQSWTLVLNFQLNI